jgi:hypothetical protein
MAPRCGRGVAERRQSSSMNVRPQALSPFVKNVGPPGRMDVGDRYAVEIAGPWSGSVEVVERTARSFRLSTLEGHMEAGAVELRVEPDGADLRFVIESWARGAGLAVHVLYDKLGIAKGLQSEMWVGACERFATLTAGEPTGPVEVREERSVDPSTPG